jgi:hypothetical protein
VCIISDLDKRYFAHRSPKKPKHWLMGGSAFDALHARLRVTAENVTKDGDWRPDSYRGIPIVLTAKFKGWDLIP